MRSERKATFVYLEMKGGGVATGYLNMIEMGGGGSSLAVYIYVEIWGVGGHHSAVVRRTQISFTDKSVFCRD
jgi:hypothetical protein